MRMMFAILAAATVATPALAADPVKMDMAMTATAEVPGPGDAEGTGAASLTIDPDKGEICYTLSAAGIAPATMAHIHKGAVGVAGPVVVPLDPPADGTSQGCKPVAADVITAILAIPTDYYVNVHNAAFPKGALRGQLGQ